MESYYYIIANKRLIAKVKFNPEGMRVRTNHDVVIMQEEDFRKYQLANKIKQK